MSTPDLHRIEALFQAVIDLTPDARKEYLDEACGDDRELRDRVEALLAADAGDSFLPEIGLTTGAALREVEGTAIGHYKLLQQIGEGGFGVVYMAEQTAPVVRKVALKIIKLGMDTREIVARFEAERQALAMMDHPNIAKVLDGGATEHGRPYFVMELVNGVPITEFADTARLDTRERLELFILVCQAVQHAHQKGIIHRDIKPSNVLVTLHDGKPVPKVIDFGIAKATNARLTEKTLFTRFQHFIGTPVYMSPEQAEMSGLDIDTRTDIYSLGVLLYELLAGAPPFDPKTLARAGHGEIQRIIREEEPQRPSARVGTTDATSVSARQGLDRITLSKRLRGDLDWIVMRALEKDRRRRYGTASDFAADIERHLRQEPVEAGPPSASYRTRKYLARNRTAVIWVSIVVLALVAGIVGTTIGMLEAAEQRDLAVSSEKETGTITDYVLSTLALTNLETAQNPDLSVRTVLDHAARGIDAAFAGRPRAEARVRATIGRAYHSLDAFAPAEHHLTRALAVLEGLPGEDPYEVFALLWLLTDASFKLERPTAYAVARRTLGFATKLAGTVDGELEQQLVAMYDAALGQDIERTEAAFEGAVRRSRTAVPEGHGLWPVIAYVYQACSMAMWYTENEPRTTAFYEEALAIRRRELRPGHPTLVENLSLLVGVLTRSGRLEEAETRIRESLDLVRKSFPADHLNVGFARGMLGEVLIEQKRFETAETELLASHDILVKTYGAVTFFSSDSYSRLVRLYDAWGKPEKAEPHRRDLAKASASYHYVMSWPIARHAFGPEHAEVVAACDAVLGALGNNPYANRLVTGDEAAAMTPDLVRLSGVTERLTGARKAIMTRYIVTALGRVESRDDGQLFTVASRAAATLSAAPQRLPIDLAEALIRLASLERDRGKADVHISRALSLLRGFHGGDSWINANSKVRSARWLLGLSRHAAAETLLLDAFEVLETSMTINHQDTRLCVATLVTLYESWGRTDDAARWRRRTP